MVLMIIIQMAALTPSLEVLRFAMLRRVVKMSNGQNYLASGFRVNRVVRHSAIWKLWASLAFVTSTLQYLSPDLFPVGWIPFPVLWFYWHKSSQTGFSAPWSMLIGDSPVHMLVRPHHHEMGDNIIGRTHSPSP